MPQRGQGWLTFPWWLNTLLNNWSPLVCKTPKSKAASHSLTHPPHFSNWAIRGLSQHIWPVAVHNQLSWSPPSSFPTSIIHSSVKSTPHISSNSHTLTNTEKRCYHTSLPPAFHSHTWTCIQYLQQEPQLSFQNRACQRCAWRKPPAWKLLIDSPSPEACNSLRSGSKTRGKMLVIALSPTSLPIQTG